MKTYSFKTALVAIAAVGCITLIAFSAKPPPESSSSLPTGWHWIPNGAGMDCTDPESGCVGLWHDLDNSNWMWHSTIGAPQPPGQDYPQYNTDDAYIDWSPEVPLVVQLFTAPGVPDIPTVRIDFLEVKGVPDVGSTKFVTFESVSPAGNTLECNHMTFKAIDGTLSVTVTDNATVMTVD